MKLNTLLTLTLAGLFTFSACQKKQESASDSGDKALAEASHQELETAVADRDSLLSLMSDITNGMYNIKQIESILSVNTSETPSQRSQMIADLNAIQQTLADRRARLEELEKKLASSNTNTAQMTKTIATLREQIDRQTTQIRDLQAQLGQANTRIGELDQQVDSLNTTVADVTTQRDAAQQQAVERENELNTCYYVVANNKLLKEHKIVESGFLRKTKIMRGDFDQNFFVTADKRSLKTIDTRAKKAEVMTGQPKDSYTITDSPRGKVIVITNPEAFWRLTNYLVVKTD